MHGTFHAYEYQDVILPLTVLKRLDDALEPTKQKTLERFNELDGRVANLNILYRTTKFNFYNTSPYTFKKLLEAPTQAAPNLRKYIDGFSDNVKEIFSKFDFDRILDKLHESELLYLALKEFDKIDLHPDIVENHIIGLAFEDLIRRFAEQSNETAGEHYTPRDVVRLMTSLLFSGEEKELAKLGVIKEIYDPACGTGGMLTVSKDYIQNNFNKNAKIFLYGQELNATTYAICKADMLIKGEDIDSIKGGDKEHSKASTLSNDQHHGQRFDYVLTNPPFGVSWEKDKTAVDNEAERGFSGRFGAGLPRISDAQFLFMQHVISKLKTKEEGGGEAAVVFNGSPLFTGDAGGGESEIRRWIFENDLLDAIIAIPEKLFFNTGIYTYIWIFSTRKSADRKNKVMLVDARNIRTQLRKNLGEKRYEISDDNAEEILAHYVQSKDTDQVKIFKTTDFAYRQITIQRPLRLKFAISDETMARLKEHRDFLNDVPSKKKGEKGAAENKAWQELRAAIYEILEGMRGAVITSRTIFLQKLESGLTKRGHKITKKSLKTVWQQIGERDEEAEICLDEDGKTEADNELKDYERVPWGMDVKDYFAKEVKPYALDAWIDENVRDAKDGKVGIVGYEIPFTRFFYKHEEPRKIMEIEDEIKKTESEITRLLQELDERQTRVRQVITQGLDQKAKMKPSGVDWMGAIPEKWEIKPLKALFQSKKELIGKDAENYTLLRLSLEGVFPKQEGQGGKNPTNYEAYQLYSPGDLVFCTFDYDVTPRTIGLVEEPGILTGAYTRLVPRPEVVSKYYYYYYLALDANKELLHLCTGLRHGLSKFVFWSLPNPVPPKEEQQLIVNFLDSEISKIKRATLLMESQVERLKEYRTSFIHATVTGKK